MSEKEKIINIVQDVLFNHHRESLFSNQTRDMIATKIASAIQTGDTVNSTQNVEDGYGVVENLESEKLTKVPIEKPKPIKPKKVESKKNVKPNNNIKPKNKNFVQEKMIEAQNKNNGLKNLKNK